MDVANRTFLFLDGHTDTREITVRVVAPRADRGAWACDYSLGDDRHTAYGEDSLQALVMALHGLEAHLNRLRLRGSLTWQGIPDAPLLHIP